MKYLHVISNVPAKRTVKIRRDDAGEEFVAELYVDGEHYEPADYFTDDKDDALSTARLMATPIEEAKRAFAGASS
jgi:hypothetical protein